MKMANTRAANHTSVSRMAVLVGAVFGGLAILTPAAAVPVFHGPTPYLSFADSPFSSPSFSYFHLEDHEDGFFNPTGATANTFSMFAVAPSGPSVDSVDGDDGVIDGSSANGRSLGNGATSSWDFEFDDGVLGAFPTHAGVVWTDVGFADTFGVDSVTFEAFDPLGMSLGTIGPTVLGDGSNAGETAEDRFFGVTDPGGISRITITMTSSVDWEVDHLQYGFVAVPEPSAFFVVGAVGLACFMLKALLRGFARLSPH